MNCQQFKIPLGYTVTRSITVVDIDTAVRLLSTRKRRNYISARREGLAPTAALRRDLWHCPHCNFASSATGVRGQMLPGKARSGQLAANRELVGKWGSNQLSLFGSGTQELLFHPEPEISGECVCPKCGKKACAFSGMREVGLYYDAQTVQIKAELCGLSELLSIPWASAQTLTVRFPIYEVVTFDLHTGCTLLELQTADGAIAVQQDIAAQPSVWEKGVVYALLHDNVRVARAVKHIFAELCGELPFAPSELLPEHYIQLTRFIGFPRSFHDAIPYACGTFVPEKTFLPAAERIRRPEDVLALFARSKLPKSKSVKRIFCTRAGLVFYLPECEGLWEVLQDVNHFRSLLEHKNIFSLLMILHQRPLLFDFVRDFHRCKGASTTVAVITRNWMCSIDYAVDYCTMNASMRQREQARWKKLSVRCLQDREDDYEDVFDVCREEEKMQFCVPMPQPSAAVQNCVIDGFSFRWLRSGNDYYMAGKALHNCLGSWKPTQRPIVVVSKDKKPVAAIEVDGDRVRQRWGCRNKDIEDVPGLLAVYDAWLYKFKLTDLMDYDEFDEDNLPF